MVYLTASQVREAMRDYIEADAGVISEAPQAGDTITMMGTHSDGTRNVYIVSGLSMKTGVADKHQIWASMARQDDPRSNSY